MIRIDSRRFLCYSVIYRSYRTFGISRLVIGRIRWGVSISGVRNSCIILPFCHVRRHNRGSCRERGTCVFYKQELFAIDTEHYRSVGTNPARLVVFFSRMGYVKKLAFEEAERTGAQLYEIKAAQSV